MTTFRKRAKRSKLVFAQAMRKRPTPAEAALWAVLYEGRKHGGRKWRQQVIVLGWIVDFYCPSLKLVVAVDGGVHDSPEAYAYDAMRTAAIESRCGFRVWRFSNEEVLRDPAAIAARLA